MARKKAHPPIEITRDKVASAEAQIVEESKKIDFYLTEYSVELLANKLRDNEFEIPDYQRDDTWEDERKSRFIESLLMGLSIPFLFFWERPQTGKLEIVDGSQRLRTIEQFLHKDFVIGELTKLTELEGMRFKDLPESRQRKIKNRSIRGIVLNEHADEQARFDIFERINTGSKIANKAEIRRGALSGPFLDLVRELAKDPLFTELAPVPASGRKLRVDEELVTRFFAYSDGLDGYKDRPSEFLFAYAKKMNDQFKKDPDSIDAYRHRFADTMTFSKKVYPLGFRKSQKATETPKTRFEAMAIGTAWALMQRPELQNEQPDVAAWLSSDKFGELTKSGGANPIKSLKDRIEFVRDKLLGVQ